MFKRFMIDKDAFKIPESVLQLTIETEIFYQHIIKQSKDDGYKC